jgi:hypothetical protein
VLNEFLDWADKQGVETFDALDVATLEAYALSLNRRTTGATVSLRRLRASTTTTCARTSRGVPAANTPQRIQPRRTAPRKPSPTTTNVMNTTSNSGLPNNAKSSYATSNSALTMLSTSAATTR